ncbi:YraN family protein [Patescibacteria group bacterium]|nr:YraN family protein [Patescibacteria group bacterium]
MDPSWGKKLNYQKGKGGEEQARIFLMTKGYDFLEMNYRNNVGEIDLIMTQGQCLVFVEVKMKTNDQFGSAEEMITKVKISQVRRVAEIYLLANPKIKRQFSQYRIDAVCVNGENINHYPNIGSD